MNHSISSHYEGNKGDSYFAYQNRNAAIGAKVERFKFRDLIKPTDRVLDFGCGGGWMLAGLQCVERVGVEVNPAAHEVCRANGVDVHESLAEIHGEQFDVIISHHCLEHVPYPIEALTTLSGLLKPGGKFVLVVPIDDWRVQKDFTGTDIDHHLHTWSPRLLANTLSEAGFKPQSIRVLAHARFPKWQTVYGKIPEGMFHAACWFWAVVRCRRQQIAVSTKA